MMLVPNYLDRSSIEGIGIFAGVFIPHGTRIWELTLGFDQIFSEAQLGQLSPLQQETIIRYGFREPKTNQLILCCDNARHFNFSSSPNTVEEHIPENDLFPCFAVRDIQRGEELTYPVTEDLDARNKLGEAIYRQML